MHRYSLTLLAVVLFGAACAENPAAPTIATNGAGQLTLLNALAPGDIALLRLDGVAVAVPLAGKSGIAELAAGPHQLQVVSGEQALATTTFTVADRTHRTAVLSGSSGHDFLLLNPLDTASVPMADAAKLRLVHTVANAPALDAYVASAGHAVTDSAARFLSGFQYGVGADARFPGYAIRPPGQYVITLTVAGTGTVVLQSAVLTLAAGEVYTFVLVRNAAENLELRTVQEQ